MKPVSMQVTDSNSGSARLCRHAGMLALVLLLASCKNPVPADQAAGQECVYVRVTGSNLPVRECRSAAEREAIAAMEREAAEEGLDDLQDLGEFGVEAPGADSLP